MGIVTRIRHAEKGKIRNKMALPLFLTPQHGPKSRRWEGVGSALPGSRRESRELKSTGKGAGPEARGRGLKLRAAVAAAAKTQTSGTVVVLSRWDRLSPFAQRDQELV